jgi:hypothetical protein
MLSLSGKNTGKKKGKPTASPAQAPPSHAPNLKRKGGKLCCDKDSVNYDATASGGCWALHTAMMLLLWQRWL